MTLVLSVLTQDYVIQVSDRCMTFERGDGALRFEEGHNKALVFEQRIGFGYTGAGEIEGLPTDVWLQERLGEGTDVQSGLQAVLDGLDRSFPPTSTAHAFVGVGWAFTHEPVPVLLCISNCLDAQGSELDAAAPRFSILEATLSVGSKAYIHQNSRAHSRQRLGAPTGASRLPDRSGQRSRRGRERADRSNKEDR